MSLMRTIIAAVAHPPLGFINQSHTLQMFSVQIQSLPLLARATIFTVAACNHYCSRFNYSAVTTDGSGPLNCNCIARK